MAKDGGAKVAIVMGSQSDWPTMCCASEVLDELKARGKMIATAESCTGGLICGALTEIAGSSAAVDRGFVTYSNEAKTELVGVPAALIAREGAVSKDVAIAMAEGALDRSNGDIAVSVTGIAGPGGGSDHKPVGTTLTFHNVHLEIMVHLGLVGYSAFLLAALSVLWFSLKHLVTRHDMPSVGFCTVIAIGIVTSFTESWLTSGFNVQSFLIFVSGAIYARGQRRRHVGNMVARDVVPA